MTTHQINAHRLPCAQAKDFTVSIKLTLSFLKEDLSMLLISVFYPQNQMFSYQFTLPTLLDLYFSSSVMGDSLEALLPECPHTLVTNNDF